MHRRIRNLHLVLGLAAAPFLLMYAISAAQMAHRAWFSNRPETSVRRVSVPAADAANARTIARLLIARGEVHGEVTAARDTPSRAQVRVVRPGTVEDIDYDRAAAVAGIATHRSNWLFVFNRLHHLGGIRHGYLPVDLWGAVLALVAILLLALGATGIYLWFKLHRERLVGGIIVAASLGFSLTLMILMRLA